MSDAIDFNKLSIHGEPPVTCALLSKNEELVDAYNRYVDKFNAENQAQIEAGEVSPLAYSSCS